MSDEQDPLVELPQDQWPILVEYFKDNFPKGLTGYNGMKTQIINKANFPDFPVGVYTAYGDYHDGVVIMMSLDFYTEFMVLLIQKDYSKLKQALKDTKRIDWTKGMLISMIHPEVTPCVVEALNDLNIKHGMNQTYLAHMPNNEIEKLEIQLPEDVYLDVLTKQHSWIVDEVYPHRRENLSEKYFDFMLDHKFGIGLFGKQDKKLRAWILTSFKGELHALQVKEKHARKGYAKFLTKYMSKKVVAQGRIVIGGVVVSNEPSKKLFTGLGYQLLDPVDWIFPIQG